MKLIVGLGNPGKEYENTRHNCGFMVIDLLSDALGIHQFQSKFNGLYAKTKYHGEDVIILKPQTYMNLSGNSLIQFVHYFKISLDDLLVIYDDLDLPVGHIRLRLNGSAGGHNGMKSIISQLKSDHFKRVRVGIDRHPQIPVVDYVLGKFPQDQLEDLNKALQKAKEASLLFIDGYFDRAMNQFNQRG